MSRNDTYLSLCLEQASLSPLHYRHGCIVVRGGKVIGKGYNDYRSGFNGGAQSTGNMGTARATKFGPKPKHVKGMKSAIDVDGQRCGNLPSSSSSKRSAKTYVAFESQNHAVGTGGGSLANRPLSLHSEMMAINSALSLSSAIACQGTARSTQWLEKPISKHTPTPSIETLRSSTARWSAVAGPVFNSIVLKALHPNSMQPYHKDSYNVEEEEEEEEEEEKPNGSKRQNTGSNYVHHHAQINYLEFQKANAQKARQLPNADNEKQRKQYLYGLPENNQYHHHGRHKKEQTAAHPQQQHKTSAIVVPQNRISTKSHHVVERIKDSRLNGADLYVARLGRVGKSDHYDCGCRYDNSVNTDKAQIEPIEESSDSNRLGSTTETKPLTGSLHDELRFPTPTKERPPAQKAVRSQQVTATYWRPCYRCISYMHSAGIKRVFWTNNEGRWESGKVLELVDALDDPISPEEGGSTGASGIGSVYVTKSEVLQLKGLR